MVFNKPNGLLTHPNNKSNEKTLRDYLIEIKPEIKDWGEENREGIVHRLDRVTSGLIVCALNNETYKYLKNEFKDRKVNKKYLAIVEGHLPSETGKIELPLKRSESNRSKRAVAKNGRMSISEYEIINSTHKHSLVLIDLITGRNHQVRVQMEYLNAPIVNDTLYGAKRNDLINSFAICLHSHVLNFTLFKKNFSFKSSPPEFYNKVMEV
ncbi:MAG: RluA family pseudouridine synthase [Candidatus Actinomarina sp.]